MTIAIPPESALALAVALNGASAPTLRDMLASTVECLIEMLDAIDGEADLEDDELEDNLGCHAIRLRDGTIISDREATDCGLNISDDHGVADEEGASQQFHPADWTVCRN